MAKSERNKTIDTTVEEGREYLDKCIEWSPQVREEVFHGDIKVLTDRVITGDTFTVMEDMAKAGATGFADLVIADPPYNLNKVYNGRVFNSMSNSEYEKYTRRWVESLKPLLKKTGSLYVCCDWHSSMVIGSVLGDYFKIRNRITWQREKGRGASVNWKNSMEDIWFATVSDDYTFNIDDVKVRRRVLAPYREKGKPKDWQETDIGNFRDTHPSNFWDDITVPFWSMAENTAHPAQKPEKLIARLILASSNEGDIVFDPFLGSGSTAVTAKKLNRHFIGTEIDERFCIWAQQRLHMADDDKTIQGFEDRVFWERNSGIRKGRKKQEGE